MSAEPRIGLVDSGHASAQAPLIRAADTFGDTLERIGHRVCGVARHVLRPVDDVGVLRGDGAGRRHFAISACSCSGERSPRSSAKWHADTWPGSPNAGRSGGRSVAHGSGNRAWKQRGWNGQPIGT